MSDKPYRLHPVLKPIDPTTEWASFLTYWQEWEDGPIHSYDSGGGHTPQQFEERLRSSLVAARDYTKHIHAVHIRHDGKEVQVMTREDIEHFLATPNYLSDMERDAAQCIAGITEDIRRGNRRCIECGINRPDRSMIEPETGSQERWGDGYCKSCRGYLALLHQWEHQQEFPVDDDDPPNPLPHLGPLQAVGFDIIDGEFDDPWMEGMEG